MKKLSKANVNETHSNNLLLRSSQLYADPFLLSIWQHRLPTINRWCRHCDKNRDALEVLMNREGVSSNFRIFVGAVHCDWIHFIDLLDPIDVRLMSANRNQFNIQYWSRWCFGWKLHEKVRIRLFNPQFFMLQKIIRHLESFWTVWEVLWKTRMVSTT